MTPHQAARGRIEDGVFVFGCDCCGDNGHHHRTGSHREKEPPYRVNCVGETYPCASCRVAEQQLIRGDGADARGSE